MEGEDLLVKGVAVAAGRQGHSGKQRLIPPNPPKEAIEARRKRANQAVRNDHSHSVANPAAGEAAGERKTPPLVKNRGYRPGRKTQTRRPGKK